MKQIIKNFNNLIKKTIFNVKNKTNNNFNNLIKKILFNVKNKTNNKFKISKFNKYFISFIALLFFYLFYLLIPLLYDKTWVQTSIENKILNGFKINISVSADISYRILPAPHFLIKNSTILINDNNKPKPIAQIKSLKVFLSQQNFLNKEKMSLNKIVINNANFSLLRSDFKLLNKYSNVQFSNKKIKINNSKIFFKDDSGEVISIVKIDKATLFFDNKKLLNLFQLKGETYAIPFTFDFWFNNGSTQNKEINFTAKSLKLNIFNKSTTEQNKLIRGKNIISFLNSTLNTKYDIKNELIIFKSENYKLKNSKFNYNGELSINPFDLNLNIDLGNYKISKLYNINSTLKEFVESGLLFNDNISINTTITSYSNIKKEIFQNSKIHFNIINGKINFNKTKFVNNKIGTLELKNSNLFFKDNNLVLNTDILIDIKSSDHLFSFLNTNKLSRRNFKNILVNLDYNISTNQFEFNHIKIDNKKISNQMLLVIEGFRDNNLNNLIKSRGLINEALNGYDG